MWLTGYRSAQLKRAIDTKVDFEGFFKKAPRIDETMELITGVDDDLFGWIDSLARPPRGDVLARAVGDLSDGARTPSKSRRSRTLDPRINSPASSFGGRSSTAVRIVARRFGSRNVTEGGWRLCYNERLGKPTMTVRHGRRGKRHAIKTSRSIRDSYESEDQGEGIREEAQRSRGGR
jgi:hypothetical protein